MKKRRLPLYKDKTEEEKYKKIIELINKGGIGRARELLNKD